MSAIEQIKKLEAEREKLISQAKSEALQQIEGAIKTLADLGFHYQVVAAGTAKATRTRRGGVREQVLAEIKKHANGITRSDLFTALAALDDKAKQSISNAVAALKKAGHVGGDGGHYKAN
jgi:hypothetical protein